jgi:hypothetical protein
MPRRHRLKLFTLIEFVVTVVVLGMLVSISSVAYTELLSDSEEELLLVDVLEFDAMYSTYLILDTLLTSVQRVEYVNTMFSDKNMDLMSTDLVSEGALEFSRNGACLRLTLPTGDSGSGISRVSACTASTDGSTTTTTTEPSLPVPTPPAAMTLVPGNQQIEVSWSDADLLALSHTATATPGGATCTAPAPASSCTITGLTNGTSYTVVVSATGAAGTGDVVTTTPVSPTTPPSAASGSFYVDSAGFSSTPNPIAGDGDALYGAMTCTSTCTPTAGTFGSSSSTARQVVARIGTDGTTVWERSGAIGTGYGKTSDLAAAGGSVYLAADIGSVGTRTGFYASTTQTTSSSSMSVVAAFDGTTGSTNWIRMGSSSGATATYGVDADGTHVAVAGVYRGTPGINGGLLAPGGVALSSSGSTSIWGGYVGLLAAGDGATVWLDEVTATGDAEVHAVAIDNTRVYAVGNYNGTPGGFGASWPVATVATGFVAAFSRTDGTMLWSSLSSSTSLVYLFDIDVADGLLVAGGRYNGVPSFAELPNASTSGDAFVRSYSLDGTPGWTVGGGGTTGTDQTRDLLINNGTVYVSYGTRGGIGRGWQSDVSALDQDVGLAALNASSGSTTWVVISGGASDSSSELANGLAATNDSVWFSTFLHTGTTAGQQRGYATMLPVLSNQRNLYVRIPR